MKDKLLDEIRTNLNGLVGEEKSDEILSNMFFSESSEEDYVKGRGDDTITLTKNELETFLQDWDQGYGSWSDTSIRIVRFLGMDETDGL